MRLRPSPGLIAFVATTSVVSTAMGLVDFYGWDWFIGCFYLVPSTALSCAAIVASWLGPRSPALLTTWLGATFGIDFMLVWNGHVDPGFMLLPVASAGYGTVVGGLIGALIYRRRRRRSASTP